MLKEMLMKYGSSGVLLDTNLFVLYLIGHYDRDYVPDFKRTCMYTSEQFDWLNDYVSKFSSVIITPHILAETWNLIEKLREDKLALFLQAVIPKILVTSEEHIDKDIIVQATGFDYIGVTDMSVIIAAQSRSCLVISDDLRAVSTFQQFGIDALNINHLRKI